MPVCARGFVQQPLDVVDRFGPARAAVGAGRRGVGQHRLEMKVDRLDVVDAGQHPGADQQLDRDAGAGRISADVGQRVAAQREDAAVGIEREFHLRLDVAPVRGGREVFAALGRPFDRPLQVPGRMGHHHVFRIDAGLHAEAAAHVADRDADLFGLQPQRRADRRAHTGRHLRADADGEALGRGRCACLLRLDAGQHRARLQRQRDHALVHQVERHAVRGAFERSRCGRRVAVAISLPRCCPAPRRRPPARLARWLAQGSPRTATLRIRLKRPRPRPWRC